MTPGEEHRTPPVSEPPADTAALFRDHAPNPKVRRLSARNGHPTWPPGRPEYVIVVEREAAFKPPEPTRTLHSPERVVDREIEMG